MKKIVLLFCLAVSWYVFGLEPYPETFPTEWKNKKLRSSEAKEIAPGIRYYHYHFDDFFDTGKNPLSLYYLIVDWDKANVRLALTQSGNTLRTVADMAREGKALAAVNGAYFIYKPVATYFYLRIDGVTYKPPEGKGETYTGGMAFAPDAFPVLCNFKGQNARKDFESYPNVIQGYLMGKNGIDRFAAKNKDKHDTPYTAIGVDSEKRLLFFMVVDGRHPKDSPGISFWENAPFLFAVGAKDVLSIDGGGSSTLVLRSENGAYQVMNHPSDNRTFDHEGARSVQNCILLLPRGK